MSIIFSSTAAGTSSGSSNGSASIVSQTASPTFPKGKLFPYSVSFTRTIYEGSLTLFSAFLGGASISNSPSPQTVNLTGSQAAIAMGSTGYFNANITRDVTGIFTMDGYFDFSTFYVATPMLAM